MAPVATVEPVERVRRRLDVLADLGITESAPAMATVMLMYARPRIRLLAGGSGGGGKSRTLRACAADYVLRSVVEGWHAPFTIGSADFPGLIDRCVSKFTEEFGEFGEVKESRGHRFHFAWHDKRIPPVLFRNLETATKRKGFETGGLGIEELTELTYQQFGSANYWARHPGTPYNPIVAVSNPDGPGHQWVKALWRPDVEAVRPEGGARDLKTWALDRASALGPWTGAIDPPKQADPADFVYLPYYPQDNPTFDHERWWAMVLGLPPSVQQARWTGSWQFMEGSRWPWLDARRTLFDPAAEWPWGVPHDWYRMVHVDWGIGAPFCALFTVFDPEGNAWTYDEIYEAGLSTEQQILAIQKRLGPGDRVDRFVGDPQMFQAPRNKHTGEAERTIAEAYTDQIATDKRFVGSFEPGPTGPRTAKAATLDRYLTYDNEHPQWRISVNCRNLWGELTGAVLAKDIYGRTTEEIDRRCADHAITAAWYGLHGFAPRLNASHIRVSETASWKPKLSLWN
jgi:hypothetical protein